MTKDEIFNALYIAMVEISEKHHVYSTLFRSDEAINTLSRHDYGVFSVFQNSLANDLMSCIFRVLDPEKSCGRDNLSFEYLKNNYSLSPKVTNKIDQLYKIKERVKLYRHRIAMHNDLLRIIKPKEQDKVMFKWSEVSEIVSIGQFVINEISETEYETTKEFIPINVNPELLLNEFKA